MNPITFDKFGKLPLYIGYRGENLVTELDVDMSGVLLDGWGAALWMRRPTQTAAYEKQSNLVGKVLHAVFDSGDTYILGRGEAVIELYGPDGELKKTATTSTVINYSLTTGGEPPDDPEIYRTAAAQDVIDAGKLSKAAQAAKTADMTQPVGVDDDGKLWALPGGGSGSDELWRPTVDISGNISWEKSTSETPPATQNIKGKQGTPGRDGQDGRDGTDGADGYSPDVTISQITGGHTVNITDKQHPSGQTFNVMDGIDGQDGSDAEVTAENIEAALGYHPAAPDGYYGESGGVFEYSTNFLGKGAPTNENNIVFRPTASQMSGQSWGTSHSVSGEIATIEKIKGRTLVFNQLIQNGNFDGTNAWGSLNGSISAVNNVCTYTISNITETSYENRLNANGYNFLNHIEGHKYLYTFDCKLPKDGVRIILSPTANIGADTGLNTTENNWLRASAILSPGALSAIIWLRVVNPSVLSVGDEIQFANVMIIDLTQMFGAGNEPATAEEFKAQFPLDYYAYNAGELISLNATGLKTVGFNAYHSSTAELLGGIQYQITGAYSALSFGGETVTPGSNGIFTVPKNGTLTVTGGDETTCVHLVWTGLRDGEYEPYWENTLALPVSTYFPDGMRSAGTVYDELTKDKAIQRIGSRAYASGDEDDSTVITDGTTTFYPLETAVETAISPALNLGYKVDDFGTEMLLPQNDDEPVTAPMDAEIVYHIDYEGQVRNNDSINITKKSMDSFISAYNNSGAGTISQTWDDVNKKYTYEIALGYTPAEIDDTAGDGDTDKTWSADKLVDTIGDIESALQTIRGVSA